MFILGEPTISPLVDMHFSFFFPKRKTLYAQSDSTLYMGGSIQTLVNAEHATFDGICHSFRLVEKVYLCGLA